MLVSLALMLGTGRLFAEVFRRFSLPAVVGEITAGILIGSTVLGRIAPDVHGWLFSTASRSAVAIEAFVVMGVTFLLLVAGMELDLSAVMKQGKSVITMSLFNILIPFAMGFALVLAAPGLFGAGDGSTFLGLYIGVALSITALPVITKILMDMKLFQTDFGMLVMTSALINDLAGWIIFSVVIQLFKTGDVNAMTVLSTTAMTVAMTIFILTVVRYLINRSIPWIQAKTEWPGGVITFIITTGLLFSALAEAIGVHAIFGAFLCGIAIGDSPHLRKHSREIIHQFINNIFAPLFFVSIGIRIDFFHNFDPLLTGVLIAVALASKVAASVLGGSISGMKIRDSLPVGCAMSARGAMEIILGIIGRNLNIINDATFVAIVIMAVVTSLSTAPLIRLFLKSDRKMSLLDLIEAKLYVARLEADTPAGAIDELANRAAKQTGLPEALISAKVMERETLMSTGIGDGIAVPHARLRDIKSPLVALGNSRGGIDFNAPDGNPARLVFLILTPWDDQDSQIGILAEISNIFLDVDVRERCIRAAGFNELIGILKMAYHDRERKE